MTLQQQGWPPLDYRDFMGTADLIGFATCGFRLHKEAARNYGCGTCLYSCQKNLCNLYDLLLSQKYIYFYYLLSMFYWRYFQYTGFYLYISGFLFAMF